MSLPIEINQKDWFKSKKFVTLSTGIKMAYVEMGNPNGEVVILQHGMTDNSRSWSLSAPYFAKAGYHVYLPDLVGQGMTGGIDELYTTIAYATNLKAFFDALNIKKAILAGHSLGSMVVQTFALFYPDRVNKVMLLSTVPIKNYLNKRLLYLYNTQIDPLKDNEQVSDKFLGYWYNCTIKEDKYKEVFNELLNGLKKESRAINKKGWRRILLGLVATNLIDLYIYFETSIPVLILHGDVDDMTSNEHQPEICSLLNVKSNSYKNYLNVGHNIQFEIPEQASLDMLKWLKMGSL